MNSAIDAILQDRARAALARLDPEFAAWDKQRAERLLLDRAARLEAAVQRARADADGGGRF
ncbi:hypothetical protein [Falsiroseomonas tokyonensis]|uniref:Uncharacterized protein n=1 Tax=Falsiroseomonas tokyonensis TaxID=430521 RepID=A0ABV7BY83_9PROT|nr:hypothetical protein [Falsiroseomonas tokyonensis]MBU8540219.1 hypothetical protein [Falsiroseomonas tokyonensis]